ncbi:MAG: M20/M25/M40 family metallo-hydrolase [Candidatus Acidiferrales bacterium]
MFRIGFLLVFLSGIIYPAQAQKSNRPDKQGLNAVPPAQIASAARAYRLAHEHAIIHEFTELLSIPNTASDLANIHKNAEAITILLEKRGIHSQLLAIPGRGPVVFGELASPGAKHTLIFYAHYDGQPVEPGQWIATEPFAPALRTDSIDADGKLIDFPSAGTPFQDNWRIYARSAGDDKAPIVAVLAAIDALRANQIPLAVNLKFVFEGEEEAGSTHLESTLLAHRDLLAGDLLIAADGPVHQSGRPLVCFANRGSVPVAITVYGPLHSLHSGHYGNWVPNPAMRLAQLLASMKDSDGHVLIEGFYEGVVPPGPSERRAMEDAPAYDADLLRSFGIAGADGGGKKLLEMIMQPSLNIDGLESGWVGAQAKTIIPDRAIASLDLRLVKNILPVQQFDRLVAHIRKQGYYVIDREPTMEERLKYSRIARVTLEGGYPAWGTTMDLPVSRALVRVANEATGGSLVVLPLMGGSTPMYIFENLGLPVISVPIANYDDNQHSPNENLRLGHFWRGIELFAALLGDLNW